MKIHLSILVLLGASWAAADEVRYYEQNGITYRETRRTVERPVLETQMQPRTQTVYKEELTTTTREETRLTYVPSTVYVPETYWANLWNPFTPAYLETRYWPTTRWDVKTEKVQVPVTCRRLVPQTQEVQTPVVTQRMMQEEIISRVAVSGPSSAPQRTIVQTGPQPTPAFTASQTTPPPISNTALAPLSNSVRTTASPTATYSAPATIPPPATNYAARSPLQWSSSTATYQRNALQPSQVSPLQNGEAVGGVARLENDPPRYGTSWNSAR